MNKKLAIWILLFALLSLITTATEQIGFEYLDGGTILHMWNPQYDFYFNESSGIQLTNHYDEYWTHNAFCGGRYTGSQWNDYCSDSLEYIWLVTTDNVSYVNYTGYYEVFWAGKALRFELTYYLELNDTELTVDMHFENIGKKDIPEPLHFIWKINDIRIDMTYENNTYYINGTWYNATDLTNPDYDINVSKTVSFAGLSDSMFTARLQSSQQYLHLKWDNESNNFFEMYNDSGEYNAPVALFINKVDGLVGYESYDTTMYWIDALDTKKEHNEDSTTPVTDTFTVGADARLLVYSIMTKTSSTRTGTPTYNGNGLTEAINLGDTGGEGTAELWYMINPPTGSDYAVSVPNAGTDEVNLVISSYTPATENATYVFVNATGTSSTTANPSIAITPAASGDVIVTAFFSGYKTVAGGNSDTLLYKRDTGGEGYGSQFKITSDATEQTLTWTQGSDDLQLVAAAFTENVMPYAILDTANETDFGADTTPDLVLHGKDADADTMEFQLQVDNVSTFDSTVGTTLFKPHNSGGAIFDLGNNAAMSVEVTGASFDSYTTGVLDYITLYLSKTGSPTGIVTVEMWGATGTYGSSERITGSALATATLDISTLTTSLVATTITFTGANKITFNEGSNYFFTVYYDAGDSVNYLEVERSSSPSSYDGIRTLSNDNAASYDYYASNEPRFLLYIDTPFFPLIDSLSVDAGGDFEVGHPYTDAEEVTYTVLPGDALVTDDYYWRARVIDSSGSNVWSDWVVGNFSIDTGGGGDTCTYSSGSGWAVLCSDDCSISGEVDLNGNDLNITGTGTFTMTADVIDFGDIYIAGTDSSNKCIVTCNGGCFRD